MALAEVEVEVAVLGPVEIRGAAQPFSRSSAQELVVYLAFHRQGVRTDVWASALWPDRCVAPSSLHSTASVARRSLGQTAGGSDHLPRTGRRLVLADTVGTDVERFARDASSADPGRWRSALALVRGRPFDGLRLGDWAVLDGTQAEVESMVANTALKGAEYQLSQGRGEEAEWMVRRGLRASPYDERLYRALLRSADAKGDRIGLRSTMAELLCVAGGGSDAILEKRPVADRGGHSPLHPTTMALFRELAHGEMPAVRGDPVRL